MVVAEIRMAALRYPEHHFRPQDLLNFVELKIFSRAWEKDLKLNTEADLFALQMCLMLNPRSGDVVPGTQGLRKLRFKPESWSQGKSSAARVLYVHFEEYGWILLVYAYRKSVQEDIREEDKQVINSQIELVRSHLDAGRRIE